MFERILKEVILPNEGGYVNHPLDKGGATNYGITQTTYDKWVGNPAIKLDVKNIPLDVVKQIYRSFWIKARCDLLWDYAPGLTVHHFDFLINTGYERKGIDAAEILQRTINQLIPTTVDGYIGPKTLGNIVAYIKKKPVGGDNVLRFEYKMRREKYYNDIVKFNPSQSVFLTGWLRRVRKTDYWIIENLYGAK